MRTRQDRPDYRQYTPFLRRLKKRISFIAPIYVYPGENEMESLALNAIGALKGELPIQIYK